MNLVFIYGAPATGKLTVATELARLTGYKLFHNHLTVDLIEPFFKFGTEEASRLSAKFRLEMFKEAAKAKLPGIIFTYVYVKDSDDEFVEQVISTVKPYGGKVMFVLLNCKKEELTKRVENDSRKNYTKVQEAGKLNELFKKYDMTSPVPHQESLIIDNTNLTPKEAANQIIQTYKLPQV
jgi:RNase adaptor protein for sRNA GlmZ degradation